MHRHPRSQSHPPFKPRTATSNRNRTRARDTARPERRRDDAAPAPSRRCGLLRPGHPARAGRGGAARRGAAPAGPTHLPSCHQVGLELGVGANRAPSAAGPLLRAQAIIPWAARAQATPGGRPVTRRGHGRRRMMPGRRTRDAERRPPRESDALPRGGARVVDGNGSEMAPPPRARNHVACASGWLEPGNHLLEAHAAEASMPKNLLDRCFGGGRNRPTHRRIVSPSTCQQPSAAPPFSCEELANC